MASSVLVERTAEVPLGPATTGGPVAQRAIRQLPFVESNTIPDWVSDRSLTQATHLQVASYYDPEHLLDLRTVGLADRLFAQALTVLEPVDETYATTKYEAAFNWDKVFSRLRKLAAAENFKWVAREFYVVEFRSKLQPNINRELLYKLDKESHREATESGGLLKYWFGEPDQNRRNLATCLWRSKDDAISGGKGAWHKQARGIISQMYEQINVKGLRLTVDHGANSWSFEPFSFY